MKSLLIALCAITVSACAGGRLHTKPSASPSPEQTGGDEGALSAPVSTSASGRFNQSEFDYRRLHSAAGQFITADELAANGDVPLVLVLSTHIRGFNQTGDGRAAPGLPPCAPDVFVDGLPVIDVLDALHPRDLLGVEYYEPASAPVKYRRAFSGCPVLLLWLRT